MVEAKGFACPEPAEGNLRLSGPEPDAAISWSQLIPVEALAARALKSVDLC
jgi:hypothetical protein